LILNLIEVKVIYYIILGKGDDKSASPYGSMGIFDVDTKKLIKATPEKRVNLIDFKKFETNLNNEFEKLLKSKNY
jgi:hypothetical protein